MHKSLKLISKKTSYNNYKKSHINKSVDENKSEQKMNKTLNKIKSNNNIILKEKNPNSTLDNFKKSEKIKKFAHNYNNSNIINKNKKLNINTKDDNIELVEKKDKKNKNAKKEEVIDTEKNEKPKDKDKDKDNNKNSDNKIDNKTDKEKDNDIDEDEPKIYFDVSNINNVQIPKEYLNTIYYNLLIEQESDFTPKADPDYMKMQKEINSQMRSILIDWLIDVHFKFGFTDETIFMTVLTIDRYLSVKQITRNKLQLLGITALMIACKHEEIDVPKIDDFIYITDNAYVRDEVYIMENDVLSTLNFSLLYPSPIKFYEYLSLHFNFDKTKHMMGKYLMESFLLDTKINKYKPATISCACTYVVMKFFKMENYHEAYHKKFFLSDETKEITLDYNIKECAKDICLFVDNVNKTNYQACQKKYSKPEQEKVSVIILNH